MMSELQLVKSWCQLLEIKIRTEIPTHQSGPHAVVPRHTKSAKHSSGAWSELNVQKYDKQVISSADLDKIHLSQLSKFV